MTIIVCYESKKSLKEAVGKELNYRETSMFGEEFKRDGKFAVAYRPSVWPFLKNEVNGVKRVGREFFAEVTMVNGLIAKVE